jgi:aspartate aminotransferase
MSNEQTKNAEEACRLSARLAKMKPSATIGLISRIGELRNQGIEVISFGQGEPDFNTPDSLKKAGIEAIQKNVTRYTPAGGTPVLRKAIAEQMKRDTDIEYTANQVTVTTGAKEALFLAFQATCDPNDEVIIPAPYWVSYIEQVNLTGATPVVIETDDSTGFKITPEKLKEHISPHTRAIILNSPSNPTGAVYTADELAALAEVIRPTNALIVSDEIYDNICYVEYARLLRVAPDFANRTLVVNGVSKTYAMTGWRVGYIAGPEPIIKAIKSIQSHSTTHPAAMAQQAAQKAYTPSDTLDAEVKEMAKAFKERRDIILGELQKIDGVSCMVPEGAFYVFPNVAGLLNRPLGPDKTVCTSSDELANYLLEKAHIGVVPGEAFGAAGYLRLSYAQGVEAIQEGMRRFIEAVKS